MKRYFFSLLVGLALTGMQAQETKIDSSYNNTYYQGRMELFENLPKTKKAIVFLGNSITERGNWYELLPEERIINRGIGGDNTFGVLARLDDILAQKPKKVFLLIGINDIGRGLPLEVITSNYERILSKFKEESPRTKVYVQSVLPMNDEILSAAYLKNKKEIVKSLNAEIVQLAKQFDYDYVDLYHNVFSDGKDNLTPDLTIDGIHINPKAYVKWVDYLKEKDYL